MHKILDGIRHYALRAWQWLMGKLVQDVPSEDAMCEFDCRKRQCKLGQWKNCERRIKGMSLSAE